MLAIGRGAVLCKLCPVNVWAAEIDAMQQSSLQALHLRSSSYVNSTALALWNKTPEKPLHNRASQHVKCPPFLNVNQRTVGSSRPLFSPESCMYDQFSRFVSRIFQGSTKDGRNFSCSAVATGSRVDELRSEWVGRKGPNGMPLPNPIHAELSPEEVTGRRIILVGDVHGCYDELVLLLKHECKRQPDDVVIFVGDLVNKGPKSPEVIALARSIGAYAVRGNHDDRSLAAYYEWADYQSGKGGKQKSEKREWVQQLTEQDVNWLHRLPFTLRIPSHNLLVVHAGLVPGIPLEQQDLSQLYTLRFLEHSGNGKRKKRSSKQGSPKSGRASLYLSDGSDTDSWDWEPVGSAREESTLWGKVWNGPEHVFFGHDAMRGLQLHKKATGLDTGCVYGGRLTAVILPPLVEGDESKPAALLGKGKLVSVKALKEYEKAKGKMG